MNMIILRFPYKNVIRFYISQTSSIYFWRANYVVNLMMQNYVDPYSLCCLFTITCIISVLFDRMVVGFITTYAISSYHH